MFRFLVFAEVLRESKREMTQATRGIVVVHMISFKILLLNLKRFDFDDF